MYCQNCRSTRLSKNGFGHNDTQHHVCKDCGWTGVVLSVDEELVIENVKLAKQKQKFADTNRIERKSFREHARLENALAEYSEEILKLLKRYKFSSVVPKHTSSKVDSAGIFHIADLHLNELVDLPFNKYNFEIASKRLQMNVDIAKKMFNAWGIKKVLVAMTGDLLNSDRRLDELLNQATNRSQASFLAVDLLKSVLLDLSQDFTLSVASVSGNESRMKDEPGWSKILLTDNYDFTIFNFLNMLLLDTPIVFYQGDPAEQVVRIAGKNILLIHGEQRTLLSNVERGVIQLCGKHASKGETIDFVIFGHLHYARIGDHFARSSSMVGANAYSDIGLQLVSKASQNIHIITEAGQLHSMKIDLQNADAYPGYKFSKVLEAYNPKSASKVQHRRTIMEIVI